MTSRLTKLSHAQLLELAAAGCEASSAVKNMADAMVAEVAPLPSWCLDILLSPDLLPVLFNTLRPSECAAASVCSAWAHAYARHLRRCRYVCPRIVRSLTNLSCGACWPLDHPNGLTMLPGNVLAVSSGPMASRRIYFVAARDDSDQRALGRYQASELAATHFEWPMGLVQTNDGIVVCNPGENHGSHLLKFEKTGTMASQASVSAHGVGFEDLHGPSRIALHEPSQRLYAVADGSDAAAVMILDANLEEEIATVEEVEADHDESENGPLVDIAVVEGLVIVLANRNHPEGSGLRLLNLEGELQGIIRFDDEELSPQAFAAAQGRAYVIVDCQTDANSTEDKTFLHVIDLASGDMVQKLRIPDIADIGSVISEIMVHDGELYIASFGRDKVVVLRFAGCE